MQLIVLRMEYVHPRQKQWHPLSFSPLYYWDFLCAMRREKKPSFHSAAAKVEPQLLGTQTIRVEEVEAFFSL